MDKSNDLIIGAYTNYNWSKIKYWANSIAQSGFSGEKVVIAYNSDADTVNRLSDMNFKVLVFDYDPISKKYSWPVNNLVIVVQRFYQLWQFLQMNSGKYRYVISTDMKDVVFQSDPSIWLEDNLTGIQEFVSSSESVRYADEPWGNDNLKGSFPMLYDSLKNNVIQNCGVQAGTQNAVTDMCFQIWSMSQSAGRPNPDQAAYNVLLNSVAWKSITNRSMGESGWACQAGTQLDPEKMPIFGDKLVEPGPLWNGTMSTTTSGKPHAILHQWDRILDWSPTIERKYG
jgi:hypothetical protein